MKNSCPVQVAEFAVSHNLVAEPAFAWWVPYTMKNGNVIISAIKSRLKVATHKYGVEVPTSYTHAEKFDDNNGNTMWIYSYALEISNVSVAFKILPPEKLPPPGWTKSSGHLI